MNEKWPKMERVKVGNCPWCWADINHEHGQRQECRDRQLKATGAIVYERDHIFNDVGMCDRCKRGWDTNEPCP